MSTTRERYKRLKTGKKPSIHTLTGTQGTNNHFLSGARSRPTIPMALGTVCGNSLSFF